MNKGVFRYPVVACLCADNEGGLDIITYAGQNMFLSTESVTSRIGTFDVTFSYPTFELDKDYYLVLAYQIPNGLMPLGKNQIKVRFADMSGVENVTSDGAMTVNRSGDTATVYAPAGIKSVEAFDLTGCRVDTACEMNDGSAKVRVPATGIIVLRAIDNGGNVKTFKLN